MNIALHLGCLNAEWLNLSYRMAYVMTIVSVVIGVACLAAEYRSGRFSLFVFYLLIVLAQPGWRFGWRELVRGEGLPGLADCGFGFRAESILLGAVAVAMLIAILCGGVRKRVFFLWLSVICWATAFAVGTHWLYGVLLTSGWSILWPETILTIIYGAPAGGRCATLFTIFTAALWIIERRAQAVSSRISAKEGERRGSVWKSVRVGIGV